MIAFDLVDSGEFVSELAWPDHVPHLVVLAGEHSEHRERWESEGWMILTTSQSGRVGISCFYATNQLIPVQ